MDKLLTNKWQKMTHWWGNPELGYDCWGKKYKDGCCCLDRDAFSCRFEYGRV